MNRSNLPRQPLCAWKTSKWGSKPLKIVSSKVISCPCTMSINHSCRVSHSRQIPWLKWIVLHMGLLVVVALELLTQLIHVWPSHTKYNGRHMIRALTHTILSFQKTTSSKHINKITLIRRSNWIKIQLCTSWPRGTRRETQSALTVQPLTLPKIHLGQNWRKVWFPWPVQIRNVNNYKMIIQRRRLTSIAVTLRMVFNCQVMRV